MAGSPARQLDPIAEIVRSRSKIRLDIGCGRNRREGWIGLDVRPLADVDVVHDLEDFPWPLPDGCASIIQASHIMEHILPRKFIGVMDEMWRVLEPGGQAWVTAPYGWSHGFVQDPTHTKPINEDTFEYFTPTSKTGERSGLYTIYTPKPWAWVTCEFELGGNMIVVLRTVKE